MWYKPRTKWTLPCIMNAESTCIKHDIKLLQIQSKFIICSLFFLCHLSWRSFWEACSHHLCWFLRWGLEAQVYSHVGSVGLGPYTGQAVGCRGCLSLGWGQGSSCSVTTDCSKDKNILSQSQRQAQIQVTNHPGRLVRGPSGGWVAGCRASCGLQQRRWSRCSACQSEG